MIKHMEKKKLISAFKKTAKKLDFKAIGEPWIPTYGGPKDFKDLHQDGIWRDQSVAMHFWGVQLIPSKDLGWQKRIASAYAELREDGAVRIPAVLHEEAGDTGYTISERPEGKWIISAEDFTRSCRDDGIKPKILEIAKMIWATETSFRKLDGLLASSEKNHFSVKKYFEKRFEKWGSMERGYLQEHGGKSLLSRKLHEQAIRAISRDALFPLTGIGVSRNIFGNTDIIKSANGFFLIHGRFELKPYCFLPAAWLWNFAMWGWKKSPNEFLADINFCRGLLDKTAPHKNALVAVASPMTIYNFIERLVAGLQVDLLRGLAPYDKLGLEERQRAIENFLFILNHLVRR